jgi:hypothetical protein
MKYDVVIIDEDIILNCIASNQCEIPVSVLEKIEESTCDRLSEKASETLEAIKTKKLFSLPGFDYEDEIGEENRKGDVIDIPYSVDIPSFCKAKYFMYRQEEDSIVFLRHYAFKKIKYIMVSATVDKNICEFCFGKDNIIFTECKTARYKGNLNQYYEKSMSRALHEQESRNTGKNKGKYRIFKHDNFQKIWWRTIFR